MTGAHAPPVQVGTVQVRSHSGHEQVVQLAEPHWTPSVTRLHEVVSVCE